MVRAHSKQRRPAALEDLEQDIRLVYRQMGRRGLESIENVGPGMAWVIEKLLQ